MNYYCLHHSPATERKKYLIDLFNEQKISVKWIEDYLPESYEVINYPTVECEHAADRTGKLNKQEISLCLKHVKALEEIIKINNYGVIFEDDISNPDFLLKELLPIFLEKFENIKGDILWIGSIDTLHIVPDDTLDIAVHSSSETKSRASHCYVIHSDICKKVLNYYRDIKAPSDWQWNYTIDNFQLKSCWSYPHILQRSEQGSIKSLLR